MRVRGAEVGEPREQVSVGLEPVGRDLALGEHAQAVRDDVVGEQAAVEVAAGLGGVEAQHVGQDAFCIDQGFGLCRGVAPDVF